MVLRCTQRRKDGKLHRYWSLVENRRVRAGRVAQRHVRYLGEINESQRAAWRKTIEVFEEGAPQSTCCCGNSNSSSRRNRRRASTPNKNSSRNGRWSADLPG